MYTLKDTTEMMTSPDYKTRFLAEYVQTKIRYEGLHNTLIRMEADKLNFKTNCDHCLLSDQANAMDHYLHTLEVRAAIEEINLPVVALLKPEESCFTRAE